MKPIIIQPSILKIIALLMAFSLFSGCSVFKPYKAPITQGTIIKASDVVLLQPGLDAVQVQAILGPPYGKDPFYPSHWDYVFYTTDKKFDSNVIHHVTVNFDSEGYVENWNFPKPKKIIHEKGFWASFFN